MLEQLKDGQIKHSTSLILDVSPTSSYLFWLRTWAVKLWAIHMFDEKGILSSVYLGGKVLHGWKMISIPFHNLNEVPKISPILQVAFSGSIKASAHKTLEHNSENITKEPAFYVRRISIDKVNQVKDAYLSFSGWRKGIAFVNEFNIGSFWPSYGPQCNLYVPALQSFITRKMLCPSPHASEVGKTLFLLEPVVSRRHLIFKQCLCNC